ncbi:MAG: phage integrase family protein, partial [Gemmobacter sp.]|nr:phage integrase family protein [Gemmobacter sp.]
MISPENSPATPGNPRRLGLHHLALFRGHLDGLDLATLGERYLDTGADLPKAKATLRWIRDALIAAARKERPGLVKLLRIPLARLAATDAAAPSLEEFQATHDPQGFYDERELIELFKSVYPVTDPVAARRTRRNQRLRQRLRDAVAWLEERVAQPPRPGDSVFAWIDEAIAARLAGGGIHTLADLVGRIRKKGPHWHRALPQIGPVTARRLESFLSERVVADGNVLPLAAVRQDQEGRPAQTGIVPLERFAAPTELSGALGANRSYSTKLAAADDRAAIEAWLASLGSREHTVRSYRTQAERFLLWMIFERGKALSSATTEDCISYRDFLNALDGQQLWYWRLPRETWIGARSTPRWSEDWRPFAGALSPSSQKLAVTILTALCEWLMRSRYLETNPWDGVPPAHNVAARIRVDHALTLTQWQKVIATCEHLPPDEAYFRLRFTLLLAYGMGLRLSELVAAKVAARTETPGRPNPGLKPARGTDNWDLEVVGKGNKPRSIPVPDAVMLAMTDYFDHRGLGRDPGAWPDHTPLITSLGEGLQYVQTDRKTLSDSALFRLLRRHFQRTAREMDNALDAGHLISASTH